MSVQEIRLEAGTASALDWSEPRTAALAAIASGKKVLWFLDLGLFSTLKQPLSAPSQFLTLRLALDHFRDTIWNEFRKFSLGVTLYKGEGNFLPEFQWNEEARLNFVSWLQERFESLEEVQQELKVHASSLEEVLPLVHHTQEGQLILKLFARDVSSDYLGQLTASLPEAIPVYALFTSLPEDLLERALLTHPERFSRLQLFFKGTQFYWNTDKELPQGICMPPVSLAKPSLLFPFRTTLALHPLAKLIPEEQLTMAWGGLETLIYSPNSLSKQGFRKVQGFLAAGGHTVCLML